MRRTVLLIILGGCATTAEEWLSVFPGHEAEEWTEDWTAPVRLGPEGRPASVSAICRHVASVGAAKDALLRALGKEVASLAAADGLTVSRAAGDFRLTLDIVKGRGRPELSVRLQGGDDLSLSLNGKKLELSVGPMQRGYAELALDRKRKLELRREADIVSVLVDGEEILRRRCIFWDDAPDEVSVGGTDGVAIARMSWASRPAPVRSVERAAADKTVLVALRSDDEESRRKAFLEARALYLRAAKALKDSPLYPRTHDGFTVGRHRLAECLYKAGLCALNLSEKAAAKDLFSRCVRTEIRGPWQERADLELAGLGIVEKDFSAAMDHVYRILYERGRRAETFDEAGKLAMKALSLGPAPEAAIFHLKRLDAHIEWLDWPMEWAARFLFKLGGVYELREKPEEAERVWCALRRRAFRRFPESDAAGAKLEKEFSVDRPAGGD